MTMADWQEVKLGDVCSSISETYHGKDASVVLVNTSDVLEGKILNHELVKNEKLKGQFKKTFKKDDILYSEIRPANKRFAYVDFDDTSYYIASTKLMVLRPNKEKILPKFLFNILKSEDIISELQHLAETRSGTFPQITFSSELAPMEILLPPMDIQKKIAGVLGALDYKIELNNKINNNLEQQARTIFRAWFSDNRSNEWVTVKLNDFISLERGISYKGKYLSDDIGVPMLNLGNILPNSEFREEKLKYYTGEYKKQHIVYPGDIIIANTDLTQDREVLGSAIFVPKIADSDIICSHHISIVRQSKLPKFFLLGLLNSKTYRERVSGYATGTTVLGLSNETILNYEFPLPPIKLIEQFDTIVESLYRKIEEIRIENKKLSKISDTLLPKLMKGEIDVSNVDISALTSADKLSFTED